MQVLFYETDWHISKRRNLIGRFCQQKNKLNKTQLNFSICTPKQVRAYKKNYHQFFVAPSRICTILLHNVLVQDYAFFCASKLTVCWIYDLRKRVNNNFHSFQIIPTWIVKGLWNGLKVNAVALETRWVLGVPLTKLIVIADCNQTVDAC